jgi:hypothetical protein
VLGHDCLAHTVTRRSGWPHEKGCELSFLRSRFDLGVHGTLWFPRSREEPLLFAACRDSALKQGELELAERHGGTTQYSLIYIYNDDGFQASCLVRDLRKAAPNSSQRPGLVEADSAAISYNREKRWNGI